ncbi:MAG: transcription antitermination factor NusB [Victivallales bacterium]|nr:transcription antitermination factor NusB [Victivallales bacterium]
MTSELGSPSPSSPHVPSVAGQVFKAQRMASRRLAMQYLFALDSQETARQFLEQELASYPSRIEEAKLNQVRQASMAPSLDENGDPIPIVQPTELLTDQLREQEEALRILLEGQHPLTGLPEQEEQENFFVLAEEFWPEGMHPSEEAAPLPELSRNANHRILRKGWSRARRLVEYALRHRDEIDRLVAKAADNWRLDRMSRVDRNILRIATAELGQDPAVSPAIVINEAIELAKTYGQKDSWRFVNGVLDRIRKELAKQPLTFDGTGDAPPSP